MNAITLADVDEGIGVLHKDLNKIKKLLITLVEILKTQQSAMTDIDPPAAAAPRDPVAKHSGRATAAADAGARRGPTPFHSQVMAEVRSPVEEKLRGLSGEFNISMAASVLGLSHVQAKYQLSKLVKSGQLSATGKTCDRTYTWADGKDGSPSRPAPQAEPISTKTGKGSNGNETSPVRRRGRPPKTASQQEANSPPSSLPVQSPFSQLPPVKTRAPRVNPEAADAIPPPPGSVSAILDKHKTVIDAISPCSDVAIEIGQTFSPGFSLLDAQARLGVRNGAKWLGHWLNEGWIEHAACANEYLKTSEFPSFKQP